MQITVHYLRGLMSIAVQKIPGRLIMTVTENYHKRQFTSKTAGVECGQSI